MRPFVCFVEDLLRPLKFVMSDLFANNVTGLGTASLLRDLEGLRKALEKLDTLSPEPEATELIEQVKDLVDISGSFNDLAMRERRKPSLHPGSASASDLIHLQSVLEGTAATTEECTVLTRAIQSSLDDIADERNAAGYATHESRLRNQVWYEELRQAFGLHTDVLRALSSAVNTLQFKHDTDEDGNLSPEARSAASTLHYQIALIDPKLNSKDLRISSAVGHNFKDNSFFADGFYSCGRHCLRQKQQLYMFRHQQTSIFWL